MDERISELLKIIQDEIVVCQKLLEHEREKTLQLSHIRGEDLLECNRSEEDDLVHLQKLEAKRSRLCVDLMKAFRIPHIEFTMKNLAEHVEDIRSSRELHDAAALLGDILQRLTNIGSRNQRLNDRTQQYAEGMLMIFANTASLYHPNGIFETAASVRPTFSQNA